MATASPLSILGPTTPNSARVLTPAALDFLTSLQREFGPVRESLLSRRQERRARLRAGESLQFLDETADVRAKDWRVAPAPRDFDDRRCEITGPVERKMMINALNSGARVFMADLEDSLSPTETNVVEGQANLADAVRRTLSLDSPDGKSYRLNPTIATLLVRPRGWHLLEEHALLDGAPMSASLFDFGLYFFHNAKELLARGTGPYFYLPKTESHLEARLWNDVFTFSQKALGIPHGTIRATVLIETIYGAFEMDEILYELRDHAAGLNAGRWDYLFSLIKAFRDRPDCVLPDRAQLTMTVPFMRAYTELLVRTCHRRGAHAIGGMAAFIPSRKDAAVNASAMEKVGADKTREANDGFDGTWVAHPDLVPVATQIFDRTLGDKPHQKHRLREDVHVEAKQLTDLTVPGGRVTRAGIDTNVDVALQYIEAWLRGQGAVALHNLMEDAATAEISRSQLWQWIRNETPIDDAAGEPMSVARYSDVRRRMLDEFRAAAPAGRWDDAAQLLDSLVLGDFEDFLTVPGSRLL
ncbi:MAG TPA: malate synthase A [Gemmatimonadaceae bacterium]|jgi:malate synthase